MDLALLGFATIIAFLALVIVFRAPVILALIILPVVSAVAAGFSGELGQMSLDGIRTVAPTAAMIMFAVLYFGLMIDAGLFEPLVRWLLRVIKDDPVRLCVVSALLPMLVALDGDGATTFLISVTALLPVHRRLGINPLVLPTIVGLSAGVMNLLPWGGPTARVMAVLEADAADIFTPVVPAMLGGLAWVVAVAAWMGMRARRQLAANGALGSPVTEHPVTASERSRPPRFFFNLGLTVMLVVLLFHGLYKDIAPFADIPSFLLFMIAFAIALPVNRPTGKEQQAQLSSHAGSVVLVTSMILAAGVFTGILNATGMIPAMAEALSASMPDTLSAGMPQAVAVTGMPLSLVFTPDAYYFGVLPVFAEAAAHAGHDQMEIGRAAILGQMTTGFPLSPLTASTFILIGLSNVSLRDHQKHMFPWAFGSTLVMTAVATLTGAI